MPSQKRVELAGSHRQTVAGASSPKPVNNNEIIQATVVIRRRARGQKPAAEEFAFRHANTRTYHTRGEYAVLHGADPADIAAVEAFAHEHGLTVSERSAARRSIVLKGTVANMQQAFGTTLEHYETATGQYRGRTGSLTIPANLEGIVTAVLGLDNRPVAKPHIRRAQAAKISTALTPQQVAQAYSFPTGATGAGQTIGIIELGGGYSASDLNTYFGGHAPNVTSVSVDGGANQPGVDPDSDGEVMLDIEVAGSVAPSANIVVYFAPNTDQGFHDAITTAVHDTTHNPSVISISWGGPEDSWTPQASSAMLEACTDGAGVGVSITVAAGDNGASDGVTDGQLHVDLPACLAPVIGCGGTKLTTGTNGAIKTEVVWNELANKEGATGGGVSRIQPKPSYQSAAAVPVQPETKFVGRGVPDVAGDADPVTGYKVRVDGQNQVIGGTSAVAPLWAGLIALINQQMGKPVGFVQPALYQMIGTTSFHEIIKGNNDGYQAGPNWNPCTGLGSPNGEAILKALEASSAGSAAGAAGATTTT
jgi:kumamolisin